MTSPLHLVLHADDLGMNRAVNEGILRGFRHGLLTSTSLMANAPDVDHAMQCWKELAEDRDAGGLPSSAVRQKLGDPDCPFDLGVHLNLTQGRPLTGDEYPAELLDAEGRFSGVFSLFTGLRRHGKRLHHAVHRELERQMAVVGDHGLRPTHLNGHQYIEMMPVVSAIVPELVRRFNVGAVRVAWEPALWRTTALNGRQAIRWPLACVKRYFAGRFRTMIEAEGISHPEAFFGTAHAGEVNLRLLRLFLAGGAKHRFVEIALHPGEAGGVPSPQEAADGWRDPLAAARSEELRMLTSPELPVLLETTGWHLGRLV